jgi:hypothetical protein
MMGLFDPFLPQRGGMEQRYSWQDYVYDVVSFEGNKYPTKMPGSRPDRPDDTFESWVERFHRNTSIVSSAVHQRALLVSQFYPGWQNQNNELDVSNRNLRLLNEPHALTRNQFFYRMELDASYSGSAYVVNDGGRARVLSPAHCMTILGSRFDPGWDGETTSGVPFDAEVVYLLYTPQGIHGPASEWQVFERPDFVIWSPEPDPVYFWKGISWVQAVAQEVIADGQATDHQQKFFENAATPSVVALMDPSKTPQETEEFARVFNKKFAGHRNAYKSWFLGGGTDVKVIGSTLESLSLRDLTGGLENRVAVRSRIPNVILGGREGLSGSSLNTGNYNSARRMLADGWLAPHMDGLAATLEDLFPEQRGRWLTWDRERVLFLQEDVQQQADVVSSKAATMRTLIDGGFDPDTVVDAVASGKLERLRHSGKLSVQLQPPDQGSFDEDESPDPEPEPEPESDRALRSRFEPEPMRFELHNHTHVTRSDVTVEPAQVTVEGARIEPQIDVHVPEQRQEAPVVNVQVEPTPINVEAPNVEVKNQVDVETPPAQVTVVGDDKKSKFKVRRDQKGRISEVDEA